MSTLIEKAQAASSYDFWFLKGGFGTLAGRANSGNGAGVQVLATNIIDILLFVAGVLAVIYLIYSGILYITAAGNPDAVKKGQQGILNAAIGIAVIVLAFFIARGVSSYIQNNVGAGGTAPTTTTTDGTDGGTTPTTSTTTTSTDLGDSTTPTTTPAPTTTTTDTTPTTGRPPGPDVLD